MLALSHGVGADSPPPCGLPQFSGETATVTCSYTGAAQSWTVPAGVTSATFSLEGAAGGPHVGVATGLGGLVVATLPVTAGSTLQVIDGGQGGVPDGGFNGGGDGGDSGSTLTMGAGGGGATDIRDGAYGLDDRILVAGGAAGSGGIGLGINNTAVGEGKGGWSDIAGLAGSPSGVAFGGDPGQPGGADAGGTGGAGAGVYPAGTDGTLGVGGAGGSASIYGAGKGGGGGGGYYGGGGGGQGDQLDIESTFYIGGGGGGGGGSWYAEPEATNVTVTDGQNAGDGSATIMYTAASSADPQVTSVTPSAARVGSQVTLKGANLQTAFRVDFAGSSGPATILGSTPTSLIVTVPADAAAGPIAVTSLSGVGQGASFNPLPVITALSADDGAAGTTVAISGVALGGATGVLFGSVPSPSVTPVSGTEVDAVVPGLPFSSGHVTVTTPGGTATTTATFAISKVGAFAPLHGVATNVITIKGQGLGSTTAVSFPTSAAAHAVPVVSATASAVQVLVPSDAVPGPLTVETGHAGPLTTTASFTPLPAIISLDPSDGAAGGTLTIIGTNLQPLQALTFGQQQLTALAGATATQIDATIPAVSALSDVVSVRTDGGTAKSQPFVFSKVVGFAPARGVAGTIVKVTGSGLATATAVEFPTASGTDAVPVRSAGSAGVTVAVPNDAIGGPLTVDTGHAGGLATAKPFAPLPKITGFDTNPVQVGDEVHILGTNLADGTVTFKLGSVTMAQSEPATATGADVVVPDTVTGVVTVTDADGKYVTAFKLKVRPTISTGPTPDAGPVGTIVTLTGKTFKGVTKVSFGNGTENATFKVAANGASLTAVVPRHGTTGPIVVTNAGGSTATGTFTVGT